MGYDIVFLNFATTGVSNPVQPLQIGAVCAFVSWKKYTSRFIAPGRSIERRATEKHGLYTDRAGRKLFKEGVEIRCEDRETEIRAFMNWLDKRFKKKVILVSHRSFGYHSKILLESLAKYNIDHRKIAGFCDSLYMAHRLCPEEHPYSLDQLSGRKLTYNALDMAFVLRFTVKIKLVRQNSDDSLNRTIKNPKNYKTKAELMNKKMSKSAENALNEQFRAMCF